MKDIERTKGKDGARTENLRGGHQNDIHRTSEGEIWEVIGKTSGGHWEGIRRTWGGHQGS